MALLKPAPVVSVLMTAFNRERFIGPAIESVLAQTFGDFELIIVDDGSTDGTVEVARRYLADPRVRFEQNQRNLGDYPNRNRAARLALGEYLKYHDSDDLMYPHCLETLVGCLAAEPTAGFALSASRAWQGGPVPMLLTPRLAYQREFFGLGMFNVGPAAALLRRDVFVSMGCFPERGPHSDSLFWLSACRKTNALLVHADLFWYRIHEGQHLRGRRAAFDNAELEWEWLHALDAPDCPLTPEEREQAKRNYVGRLARRIVRDIRNGAWALAWFRARHARLTWREWLRYARHSNQSLSAGTPLSDDGDILIPAPMRGQPRRLS